MTSQFRALQALTPPDADQATVNALIDHLQTQVAIMNNDPVAAVNELGMMAGAYQPAAEFRPLRCSTQ